MNQQIINNKLNQIKENQLSPEEVDKAVEMVNCLASKITISYLLQLIDYYCKHNEHDHSLKMRVVKKLKAIPVKEFIGFQEITFKIDEIKKSEEYSSFEDNLKQDIHKLFTNTKLRFQLSIVPKDYETQLKLPPIKELINSVFFRIDYTAKTALGYYHKVIADESVMQDLGELLGSLDCATLKINTSNRSMYLDETFDKRIGVLCYFVDDKGNPFKQ